MTMLGKALRTAACCAIGIAATATASAGGVYKWRDAQGNLHFSDTPPPGAQVKGNVDRVAVQAGYGNFNVTAKSPIRNSKPGSAASVSLSRFTLRLGAVGRSFTVGRAFSGRNCENATDMQWDEGIVDLKGKLMQQTVAERFRDAGYRLSVPDGEGSSAGGMDLEADMIDLKIDACSSVTVGNHAGIGSRTYMKLRWKLKDAEGAEVFTGSSEGAHDGWYSGTGVRDSLLKSVAQAADNLLGDAEFSAHLVGGHLAGAALATGAASQVVVSYGNAAATFRAQSGDLLESTVTVKTDRGHGSGVVVDAAGYALTNAHVVGQDDDVQVVIGGKSLAAHVVKADRRNDVALLHFNSDGAKAAPLARGVPHPGDPLYVVGTPLSLELSHSVTEGILSAVRTQDGARLYQTDAAVNPGNSGGPVFDETGELVAIAVSGLVGAEGNSLNVNYLIPIERALDAVGVAH